MNPIICAHCKGDVPPVHDCILMRNWQPSSDLCLHFMFGDVRIKYVSQISQRSASSPGGTPRDLPEF